MDDGQLPPPFLVGQNYLDREGEYTVISTEGDRITIERPDGRRTIQDAILKSQIHRNIVIERDAGLTSARTLRKAKRPEPSRRRKVLIERILQMEEDGANHTGVEIDQLLAGAARDLGYSPGDLSNLHPKTGRSVFANDGDWAKATMTEDKLHEVVGKTVYSEGGIRLECNVYRITPRGLDELRNR
jgi:hypothetical protein